MYGIYYGAELSSCWRAKAPLILKLAEKQCFIVPECWEELKLTMLRYFEVSVISTLTQPQFKHFQSFKFSPRLWLIIRDKLVV
jgi:hypothetical protein